MKLQIKTKLVLILVLFWSIGLFFILAKADSNSGTIQEAKITIAEPLKNGSFFISSTSSSKEQISPVLETDFPFNALYIKWQNQANQSTSSAELSFNLYVRFLNETWSEWLPMQLDDDNEGKDTSTATLSSQMIPTKLTESFQYKIVLKDNFQATDLKNLEFYYLDSSKGPKTDFHMSLANDEADSLKIISRAEWGANESYGFDSTGANLWEQEYYLPKKFVVHHTAGEKANQDPMASVRAIQYWHAVGQDWGDIGYNYLIDSKGNIYEGRKGGDGVVGGHAYLRNRNTIGIAILGCYQDENISGKDKENSNCNTPDQLTEATQASLEKLIAVKSREFNIDPQGESQFHDKVLPNVIGHRDVGNTTCPGNLIYNNLTQTRKLAANALKDLGGFKKAVPATAEFVRQSATDLKIEDSKTAEIIVEYRNTGQGTWHGYQDAGVYVTDSGIKKKLAVLGSVNIALAKNTIEENTLQSFTLINGNVKPGEIGKFKLTLKSPQTSDKVVSNFTLAWKDKGYFPQSDFSITVQKIACTTCGTSTPEPSVNQPIYAATLDQANFPEKFTANSLEPVTITFRNSGNQILEQKNLKLKIFYDQTQISPFRNDSWYSEYASIIPNEATISINNLATFQFKLKAPAVIASFPHVFRLYYQDQLLTEFSQKLEVVSAYASQVTANTIPIAVKRSWRPKVKLTFKNTGTQTWTNLKLKSYDIDYTNSWFKDSSWVDKKTVKQISQKVAPGEEITFEFKIQAYWKSNTYPQIFKLYDENNEIYINGKTELLLKTRVD